MPRIRKEKNRSWSKEEKMKMISKVLEGESSYKVDSENDISSGMLRGWVNKFKKEGEESLKNKKKPGNSIARYANKKHLTPVEALQYENMKLRIENEQLKKSYKVKGNGTAVIFKK